MDELKLLIEMVANLPSLAVWVLVGYLIYKVAVVGSIYGVIRLLIVKGHDWATKPKPKAFVIGTKAIDEHTGAALNAQIERISTGVFMHMTDVHKLRDAIDEKMKNGW